MSYKIGSFTFDAGDEPERWDAGYNNIMTGDHAPFEPFNYLDNLGLGVTSLVMQGYFTSRTEFEELMAEYKNAGEILAQVQEWDGTERQFFGIAGGQAKETKVGMRKGVYDYMLEIACPDPFKYGTALQYEDYQAVANSDVSFSVATGQVGLAYGYPMFILNNDSGGTVSDVIFYAGDGGTAITGGRITVSLGDLADGARVVIAPIMYDTGRDVYVLRAGWLTDTGAITLASDDVRIEDTTGWTHIGSATLTWPRLTPGATTTIECKTNSATNIKVGMQWRKAY